MSRVQNLLLWICALLALPLMSCNRPLNGDPAKITISLPALKAGKFSTMTTAPSLMHVAINVTAADMTAPAVLNWDSCHGCSTPVAPPTAFTLNSVPSGTARLIQVLGVYQDPTTSEMIFYYGDTTSDISGTSQDVSVAISQVSSGTVTSGQISGRYFDSTTGGPTGLIDIKFDPGNGKPALIVGQSSIFNGWFSFFGLSGAKLQYVLHDTGVLMWGQSVSLDAGPMDPADPTGSFFGQRVRTFIPVHVRKNYNNGTTTWVPEDAQTFVWGYWGPGASAKLVCTSGLDSSPVPQQIKQYVTTNYSSAPSFSVTHVTSPTTAVPTVSDLINTTTPSTSIVVQGGTSTTTSGCGTFANTTANQFLNFQLVSLPLFDGNGGDGSAGFHGIFRGNPSSTSGGSNFLSVSNTDPRSISGQVLPGIETLFDNIRLFKRVNSDGAEFDAVACADAAAGNLGFVAGSTNDSPIDPTAGTFDMTTNISAADVTTGVSAVACPVYQGAMASVGTFISHWMFNTFSGGSSGGSMMATAVGIVTPQQTNGTGTIGNNLCTPIMIQGMTSSGQPTALPMGTSLSFTTTDASVGIYMDNYCGSAMTSTSNIGNGWVNLYIKRTVTSPAATTSSVLTVSGSSSSGALSNGTATMTYADVPATITPKIRVQAPSTIPAYQCFPISYQSWHDDGTLAMMVNFQTSLNSSYSLTLPTITGLTYYSDGSCQYMLSTPSEMLGSMNLTTQVFAMYTGAGTSLNLQPTALSPASPMTIPNDIEGGLNVPVSQPGPATQFNVMAPMSMPALQCNSMMVQMTDSMFNSAPAPTSMTVSLTSTVAGAFYADSGCSTAISSLSFPAGAPSENVWFKATSTGSSTITATSTNPAFTGSTNMTITPPTFTNMVVVMPGQTYSGGLTPGGSPATLAQGVTYGLDLYLLLADGTQDPNANGYLLTSSTYINGGTMPAFNTINFTGGHATVTFTPSAAYSNINFNFYAQGPSGNMASGYGNAPTVAPATQLSVYMSNATALAPGGCQIFAVIPENTDGYAPLAGNVIFNFSATGGAVYSDATCTTVVPTAGVSMGSTSRIGVFYYSLSSASTGATVTLNVTSGGFSPQILNVNTNAASTGTPYELLFTGRFANTKATVCQPYLISVADSTGRSVAITTSQTISASVGSGGGTAGTFTDQNCAYPYTPPTTIGATPTTNYAEAFLTALVSGSTNILQASGSPLTPASVNVISY